MMKKRFLSLFLALALCLGLCAVPSFAAGASGSLSTNFSSLKIYDVEDGEYTLGETEAGVTVLVIGRVSCAYSTGRLKTVVKEFENQKITNGRVYLLDLDNTEQTVRSYVRSKPSGAHIAWSKDPYVYDDLFWEIFQAVEPMTASVTLPCLCVLDRNLQPVYFSSYNTHSASALTNALATAVNSAPSTPSTPSNPSGPSAGELRNSGGTAMSKLTRKEIVRLLQDNPKTLPSNVFVTEPSISNPYAPGKVKDEALQAAANRLSALRRIAGLPAVELDKSLCENAQYGAVLLAVSDFSHYPAKPADMDNRFYETAKGATSSSNIAANNTLTGAPDRFMNDDSASNVVTLGHRRWQLNPTMGKVGFGYAKNPASRYGQYVDEKVFDRSGAGCDYDFIGWPASGNFPSNLFGGNIPWSVTLNPAHYQTPKQSELTVTLTRKADGRSWTFSGSNYTAASSGAYFGVNTGGYGVSNCIIFRPGGITAYEGVYTVKISGLKRSSGQAAADFTYEVDFFDLDKVDLNTTQFNDVEAWCVDAVNWAVDREITNGVTTDRFGTGSNCTQAQILTFLWRAAGKPNSSAAIPVDIAGKNVNWAEAALRWAAEKGMIDGTLNPTAPCTRADAVTYIWQALGKESAPASNFTDVPARAKYAAAVDWAFANGITNGTTSATFGPSNTCTRAQIVTFLHRAYVPSVRLK